MKLKLRLNRNEFGSWWVVPHEFCGHQPLDFCGYALGYVTVTGHETSRPIGKHQADAFLFYVEDRKWGSDWSTEVVR